jgi:hypothetical protein
MAELLELRGSASGFFVWYRCLIVTRAFAMCVAVSVVDEDTLVFLTVARKGDPRDETEAKTEAA